MSRIKMEYMRGILDTEVTWAEAGEIFSATLPFFCVVSNSNFRLGQGGYWVLEYDE